MTSLLKKETKPTLAHLHNAMERLVMITGDNEYTACDVAARSGLIKANNLPWVILRKDTLSKSLVWVLPHSGPKVFAELSKTFSLPHSAPKTFAGLSKTFFLPHSGPKMFAELSKTCSLCISGSALTLLDNPSKEEATKYANVFARVSPTDKEGLIICFKKLGTTLMCGDGTNDVSALKRAMLVSA